MRLFTAIELSDEIKGRLSDIVSQLKPHTVKGNFTLKDNFHITLVFIGETDRKQAVRSALDSLQCEPFELTLSGLGTFARRDTSVVWMGIQPENELSKAFSSLKTELSQRGIMTEYRDFKAHLTLGREVVFKKDFDLGAFGKEISPIRIKVKKVSLFKSERIAGRLTYTEIYARIL